MFVIAFIAIGASAFAHVVDIGADSEIFFETSGLREWLEKQNEENSQLPESLKEATKDNEGGGKSDINSRDD